MNKINNIGVGATVNYNLKDNINVLYMINNELKQINNKNDNKIKVIRIKK